MPANNIGINMLKELIKLANELDQRNLLKEADALDELIIRGSFDFNDGMDHDELVEHQTKHQNERGDFRESTHHILAALGLIPVFGEPFDLVNAALYLGRNKPVEAILSLISVFPGWGDLFGKGTMVLLPIIRKAKTNPQALRSVLVEVGGDKYTLIDLARHISDDLDDHDDDIKTIISEAESALGKSSGSFQRLYEREIKIPLKEAAAVV